MKTHIQQNKNKNKNNKQKTLIIIISKSPPSAPPFGKYEVNSVNSEVLPRARKLSLSFQFCLAQCWGPMFLENSDGTTQRLGS